MTSAPPPTALLGLGTMGWGMARSMLTAGLPLTVWNRTASKGEGLDGAAVTATAADAVAGASIVVTMLSDADATSAVMLPLLGHLTPGALWIQMGTVGLAGIERLSAAAAEAGVAFVDAPVSGTKQPALEGKLAVIAAGPNDLRPRCEPIFEAVGQRTTWVSERLGDATRLKLVVNGWLVTLLGGLAEAVATAEALGINPALFLSFIDGGPLGVPYAQLKGRAMIERAFPPSFSATLARKDTGLVVQAASAAGLDLQVARAVAELFDRAITDGHGDEDMAAIIYGLEVTSRAD